jgi:hypothetical protein
MESLAELREKFEALTVDNRVGDFSFEVGWVPLLLDLAIKIENLAPACRQGFAVWQVKEKYGRLSIQAVAGPEIDTLIESAEQASTVTCAICGKSGELITHGWFRVLCVEHQLNANRRTVSGRGL